MGHRTSRIAALVALTVALGAVEGCGDDESSSPGPDGAAGANAGSAGEGGDDGGGVAKGGTTANGGAAQAGGSAGGDAPEGGSDPGTSGAGGSDTQAGGDAGGTDAGGSGTGDSGSAGATNTPQGGGATAGSSGDAGQAGDAGSEGGSPSSGGAPAMGGESGSGGDGGAPALDRNVVFVSSLVYTPQSLGGLEGADALCQGLADGAGLEGTFVAWLSDSTTDARDRLGTARGWMTTDGKPFVDRVEDLVAGNYWYPPQATESGSQVLLATVMTGTAADGTARVEDGDFCQDYSGDNAEQGVVYGATSAWGEGWTAYSEQFIGGNLVDCTVSARLYCFQIDHDAELVPDFPASRRVFVTRVSPTPMNGIEGFDDQCDTEAGEAGLVGTFLAFVSTAEATAVSRFDLGGDTWAHVSGVPIVENAADIADATSLLAPITYFADGASVESGPGAELVYAGAALPNVEGTDPTTCNDWSISVFDNKMMVGRAGQIDATWWNYQTDAACNTWRHVYCFEE